MRTAIERGWDERTVKVKRIGGKRVKAVWTGHHDEIEDMRFERWEKF